MKNNTFWACFVETRVTEAHEKLCETRKRLKMASQMPMNTPEQGGTPKCGPKNFEDMRKKIFELFLGRKFFSPRLSRP